MRVDLLELIPEAVVEVELGQDHTMAHVLVDQELL
jgi:hypothetical protein